MTIFRPRIFVFSAVFLFVIEFIPQQVASASKKPNVTSIEARGRLIKNLLATYNRLVIPATDKPVIVNLELTLLNIFLDEQERKFTINGYFAKQWDDVSLRWKPTEYDNIHEIRLPVQKLWSPDIVLYNYRELGNPLMAHDNAVVYSSGNVGYYPRIVDSAVCALDMSKYPFDTQTCKLKYGSWVYSAQELNITALNPINLDSYVTNEKWELMSAEAKIDAKTYPCCPETYLAFILTFGLRRKFVYSCQTLIFPAIIIGALIPFMFLLPSESKERITLGIALIVVSVMQINVINSSLPKNLEKIPVILTYHVLTLMLVALSVILSIIILNIYNRGPRRKRMPEIMRKIFLQGLCKLFCLGSDTYHQIDEKGTMSMRGVSESNGKDVVVGVHDDKSSEKPDGNMDEMKKDMQSLAQRDNVLDSHQEIFAEWQRMALVIDRIMFILFFLIFVISTICLFPNASYKGIKYPL